MSQQINLYNPIFLKQEKHFSAGTMVQALGIVMLGALGVCAFAWHQVSGIQRLAEDSERSLKTQREQLVQLGTQLSGKGRSRAIELEIERSRNQLRERRALLASLQGGEQGGTEGFSGYFAAFARSTTKGVWLTGFSLSGNGNELSLRGRALHADMLPAYLDALSKEQIMRGRQVVELKLSGHTEPAASAAGKANPPPGPAQYVEFSLRAPARGSKEALALPGTKPAPGGAS